MLLGLPKPMKGGDMPIQGEYERKEYARKWYQQNKEQRIKEAKVWYEKNKEDESFKLKRKLRRIRWIKKNPNTHEQRQEKLKNDRTNERSQVLKLMGNMCLVCGIDDPIFLQIDHVNNDGYKERVKSKNGYLTGAPRVTVETYLENPKKYQLLCANCNIAKHLNGGKLYKPKKKKG